MNIFDASKEDGRNKLFEVAKSAKDVLISLADICFPIASVVDKGYACVNEISNALFYKKLWRFLNELERDNVSDEEINSFLEKIDDKKDEIAEFMLNLINSAESEEKAKVLGIIYKAAIKGKVEIDMMLRLCSIAHRAYVRDFYALPNYVDGNDESSIEANNFINYGLINNFIGGIWVNSPSYELNNTGDTLYRILKEYQFFNGR